MIATSSRSISNFLAAAAVLAWALAAAAQQPQANSSQPSGAGSADVSLPPVLLAPGQIQALDVYDVKRVAIGQPDIADVTIVTPMQLLIQAKRAGATNLIVWDVKGQRQTTIKIVDPVPEEVSKELSSVMEELRFDDVKVELRSGKVFLVGTVDAEAHLAVLEQMVSTFEDIVVNLVSLKVVPPPPLELAPMVKLSVQVVEIGHTDVEKLGVSWSSSMTLTEPEIKDITSGNVLRFGTSLTRSSVGNTINALISKSKARVLSEPTLVTASGKEASSFIGVEVPVIQATSVGTDSTSVNASLDFRETGVMLKITPTVIKEAQGGPKITTVLNAEVSDVDKSVALSVPVGSQTISVPGFKSRSVTTEVTTASGETIVIAGLLDYDDSYSASQVPGLGNLPVLGRLFRSPETTTAQTELVITVTPELMEDSGQQVERSLALEQALAVAEVTASVSDPRLRYALQLQERIAKQLRYPQREKELGLDGTVKLRLHLFADGTLGKVGVSSSSGIEAFDLEALKAAESQSPYPPFPSQMSERELWLEIPVIFRP